MDNLTRTLLSVASTKADRTSWIIRVTNNSALFGSTRFYGPGLTTAKASDGSIYLGGTNVFNVSGNSRYAATVVKFSEEGDVTWSYQYDDPNTGPNSLQFTEDLNIDPLDSSQIYSGKIDPSISSDLAPSFKITSDGVLSGFRSFSSLAGVNSTVSYDFLVSTGVYGIAYCGDTRQKTCIDLFRLLNDSSKAGIFFRRDQTLTSFNQVVSTKFSNAPTAERLVAVLNTGRDSRAYRWDFGNDIVALLDAGTKSAADGGGPSIGLELTGSYPVVIGVIEDASSSSRDINYFKVLSTNAQSTLTTLGRGSTGSGNEFSVMDAVSTVNNRFIVALRQNSGQRVLISSYTFNPSTNTLSVDWDRFISRSNGALLTTPKLSYVQGETKCVLFFGAQDTNTSNSNDQFSFVLHFDFDDPPSPGTYDGTIIETSFVGYQSGTANVFTSEQTSISVFTGQNATPGSYSPSLEARTSFTASTTRTSL